MSAVTASDPEGDRTPGLAEPSPRGEGMPPEGVGPMPAALTTPLSSARAIVLNQLAEADGKPLRAQEVAAALGQHVNTTREHLEGLVAEGLAVSSTEKPRGRGRPATLYSAMPGGPMWPIGRQYAALSEVLAAQIVASALDPAAMAYEAGQRWGLTMLGDSDPSMAGDEVVHEQFVKVGFEPERTGEGEWHLHRCPLLQGARKYPEIVCNVHRGLIATLMAGHHQPVEVEMLPFVTEGACIVRMTAHDDTPGSGSTTGGAGSTTGTEA